MTSDRYPTITLPFYSQNYSSGETKKEKPMRDNKWTFEVPSEQLIDFNRIAEDLSGEHPILFVNYGKTVKYVVVSANLMLKAVTLNLEHPEIIGLPMNKMTFIALRTKAEFVEWLNWARQVKQASWPESDRKNNVVEVSMPTI